MRAVQANWIKTHCRHCGSQTLIHRDWINPDPDCGVCKLVHRKFVNAIELLLVSNYLCTPDDTKRKLRYLIKLANKNYNINLGRSIERSTAWRIAERDLADQVWNNKELRKTVIFAIKELRKHEKEDAKAELRNELRAARSADRTRRWTG